MDKKNFPFFESYYKSFMGLSPEIVGEIILAMGAFYFDDADINLDGVPGAVYALIEPILENSKHISEVRSKAAKGNGAPKGNKNASKNNQEEDKEQTKTNKIQTNEGQKQTDKEKDKERDKEMDNISPLLPFVDYEAIVNDYNNTCISYPKVTALSEARKKAIKARLKTVSIEDIHKAFEMAEQSDFLKGANNRNWSANFDWIMKDANLAKILDGNYTNKGKTQQDGFEWLSQQIREGAFHDEG